MSCVHPPTVGKIGVFPLTQSSALEKMFHAAPPGTFLQISSKRQGLACESGGKAYVHPLYALPSERRYDFAQIVQAAIDSGDEAVYTTLAAFNPSVRAFPSRDQPYNFSGERCARILGIWLDLDVGRSEFEARDASQRRTSEEALSTVRRLVEEGTIPLPTMTAESGRGRYLFYIFATAVINGHEARRRSRAIHDELIVRLSDLAPDRSSGNVVQLFKAPGSPSARGPVCYALFEQGDITAPLYTLEALEQVLGVPREESNLTGSQPERQSPRRKLNRSPQQSVAWARKRMDELRRLVPLRTRWQGYRHPLLLAYAEAARWWFRPELSRRACEERAFDATARFNHALPDPEDESVIRTSIFGSKLPTKPQRNETVARNLAITVDETRLAQLVSLAHPDIVKARSRGKRQRAEEKEYRDREIYERLLSGEAVSSIAKDVGMSRSAVYQRRKKLGVAG